MLFQASVPITRIFAVPEEVADDSGLKIGLEGEKQFKKALSEINPSFKVLGSEMKLVSSQFAKTTTRRRRLLSKTEQAAVEQARAATALTKAQTAQIYVDMQAIDPSEVRHKLASDEDFDVEDIVEEDDNDLYNALFGEEAGKAESNAEAVQKNLEQEQLAGGSEQTAPATQNPPQEGEYKKDEAEKVNISSNSEEISKNVLPFCKKATIIKTWEADVFNEADHPRDETGRFTEGGGGGSGGSSKFSIGSKEDLDNTVKSGRAKMSLKASAQSKHHEGTKKYNDAVAKGKKVSTLSIPDDEVQSLVKKNSGSGTVYINRKSGQIKETIDCGKPVGEYVSMSGKKSQTTRLTVHHSKDGFHAVPASSGGKNNEH